MLRLFLLLCFTANVLVDSIPLEKPVIEGYVIGGNDTDISKVPYHVAVLFENAYACGGFIVSPTHVVTAAQCLYIIKGTYAIRAGSTKKREGGVTVQAKTIHLNPKYNREKKDYDVAVIELATPLKLNDKTIKSIKLATKEPSTGSLALVSGWGGLDDEDNPINTLQSVTIPVYDRKKCEAEYKAHNMTITPRMMCAGERRKGYDIGDEGGPLVYKGEVVGIVSFGPAWEQERTASVFTSLANPEITKFIKDIAKL